MIRKVFCNLALACGVFVLGASAPAVAAKGVDESLLAAYDAYRAGDPMKFARHAKNLDGHLLEPWLDYWRVAMRLDDLPNREVRAVLEKHKDLYVAERLRSDWLRVLGRRGDWSEFDRELGRYPRSDDLEVRCYAWMSRIVHGDERALDEAMAMWLEPTELPEGCAKLGSILSQRGRLTITHVWRRVRLLFENGQITAAKNALSLLPRSEAPDERALAEAARQPKRLISRLPSSLDTRAAREVVILAAVRYARTDPSGAAAALEGPLGELLSAREAQYLWGVIAHEAAREHHDKALAWYARAGDSLLENRKLAWKVRAALREGDWVVVRNAIDRMSLAAAHEPVWIYWYGRALSALGEETGSRAYFLRIAGQTDFYGLLASEELGYTARLPDVTHVPTEEQVAAAGERPGLRRALELIRLGIRVEGSREWIFSIRDMDDEQLIAASELARRNAVYDRAIHTADRTVRMHNFSLRYPMPYQDVFLQYARAHNIDEAWVLGLVRQESRFNVEARSSAGAAGLMQVMPGTARYMASRIGLRNYRQKNAHDIETNVTLGTGYLKLVLTQLGNPVLASAAYNAGPSRARRWRDDKALEGAVYIESIPFTETRDYVKKVMANSVFYAAVLDKRPVPLKSRLGVIAPPGASEPPVPEEFN